MVMHHLPRPRATLPPVASPCGCRRRSLPIMATGQPRDRAGVDPIKVGARRGHVAGRRLNCGSELDPVYSSVANQTTTSVTAGWRAAAARR